MLSRSWETSTGYSRTMITGARLVPYAYAGLATLIALNGLAVLVPSLAPAIGVITEPNERSVSEISEALFWFVSSVGFLRLTIREVRASSPIFRIFCYGCFTVLTFTVFGEEISWGQHLGLFDASEEVKAINAQQEFNFHNLNLNLLLGIPPDHPLHGVLWNFGNLLSPAFQLFCVIVWGILPLVRKRFSGALGRLLDAYPTPSRAVSLFLITNMVAYILIDKLLFDVAEILEVGTAATAIMVVLDQLAGADVPETRSTAIA